MLTCQTQMELITLITLLALYKVAYWHYYLILVEIRPLYTSIYTSLEGSIFHSASNDYETINSVSVQLSGLILKSRSGKHGWKTFWFTVPTCSVDCHNFTKWARAQFVLCQHTELVLCPRLQPWHHQPSLSTRNWHWMPVMRTEVYSLWPKNRNETEKLNSIYSKIKRWIMY